MKLLGKATRGLRFPGLFKPRHVQEGGLQQSDLRGQDELLATEPGAQLESMRESGQGTDCPLPEASTDALEDSDPLLNTSRVP